MTTTFNGKQFAAEKEKILAEKISKLKSTPKLVSILIGTDKASVLYTNLKQKTAKRIGIDFEIKKFKDDVSVDDLIDLINKLNKDKKVNGIMVQLPLPEKLKTKTKKILNSIDPKKDVDGLASKSYFTAATGRAISEIVKFVITPLAYVGKKAAVVGADGMVGKSATTELKKLGFKVTECDVDTRDLYAKLHEVDIVVSATGVPDLIKGEMLKEGVIAIDVGAPVGDFNFKSVAKVASFVTPVPGGVGPVTIICLLENLVESMYNT